LIDSVAMREEHLEAADITVKLRSLGVSTEQLARIFLSKRREGFRFALWNFYCPPDLPPEAMFFLRPYAVLKYLILEEPPWSPDRDAAWELVALAEAHPLVELARDTKKQQSLRAKKSRGKISDEGKTVRELVEQIVRRNPDGPVQQLWSSFFDRLENLALTPRVVTSTTGVPKESIEFEVGEGRRQMSLARFKNIVSEINSKKKSR
jgi:hypothetical protein